MAKKSREDKLQEMQKLAKKRGGQCISTEYLDVNTPLWWKCCKPEHAKWEAAPNHVKDGTWCPQCANEERRLGLEEMQELARQRGGWCLSAEY